MIKNEMLNVTSSITLRIDIQAYARVRCSTIISNEMRKMSYKTNNVVELPHSCKIE